MSSCKPPIYVQEPAETEQLDPPELELHMVISCHVGAGN